MLMFYLLLSEFSFQYISIMIIYMKNNGFIYSYRFYNSHEFQSIIEIKLNMDL